MTPKLRQWCAAGLLALFGAGVAAQAPADAPAPPPAAPAAADTNAERAKTQPYNNAPFWRAVRESGAQAGTTSLPGAETGVLIQELVQYPGSKLTTAGEAWREVRNRWIDRKSVV